MSAAEIIKELPKLTVAERRQVARKLAELVTKDDSRTDPEFAKTMEVFSKLSRRYRNALRELAK
jgi:hypothetical protein